MWRIYEEETEDGGAQGPPDDPRHAYEMRFHFGSGQLWLICSPWCAQGELEV